MTFRPYEKYKDSGVEWLREVPAHWDAMPIKRLATMRSGEAITADSIEEEGAFPVYGGNGLRGYASSFTHEGEYALIGRQGALCGNVNYAKGKFWASEHAVVVSPIRPVATKWLGEVLRTMNLNQYSVSAAQPGLSVEMVSNLAIPVPPLTEQAAIATFLDHETAKIDALVEEQKRLIELLKEKRQAVISHAVTKGLNPNAPMKDSGVEWLGKVPAHWSVGAVGYLSEVDTGSTPDRSRPEYWGGDIPWLKTGEIDYAPIHAAEEFITESGIANSAAKVAPPGTLLMAMYGQGVTRGRVAILEISAAYNQACAAMSIGPQLNAKFVRYFFIAAYSFIRDFGNETSQMNLSAGIIRKFKLTVPPLGEQAVIVEHLDRATVAIDRLFGDAESGIALLQERRTALISAAVTGKIDVRASAQRHGSRLSC